MLGFAIRHHYQYLDFGQVLRLEMVDKSTSLLQTHFGRFFVHEAVQTGSLFQERGSLRVLLRAHSPTSPRYSTAPTFGKGQESTSHAVHRRWVQPAAIAGVRWRSRCASCLPPRGCRLHERHSQGGMGTHKVIRGTPPLEM